MLQFAAPQFLWLVAPVVVLLALLFRWARKRRITLPWSFPIVVLACTLLVFALAEPMWQSTQESSDIVAALDVSDSVDATLGDRLLRRLREFETPQRTVSVLPFSESTAPVTVPLREIASFGALQTAWSGLNRGQTNIEQVLVQSARLGVRQLLIGTDGMATKGDAYSLIDAKLAVQIFPIADSESLASRRVIIERLHVPLVAPAQRKVPLRVTVGNSSKDGAKGRLQVFHDTKLVLAEEILLAPGEHRVVVAESDPSLEGVREVKAVLDSIDGTFASNSAIAYLSTEQRERVLILNGSAQDERFLAKMLENEAYQVVSEVAVRGSVALPSLQNISVVVLNNIPATSFQRSALGALASYVRNGGGLIMVGGDRSFGLGGYIGTEVEPVLPVELLPPQTEKKRLNVAVELVLDKSRSMATDQRIEFAKEAAKAVVEKLRDEDYIGVIGFDVAPFIALELTQLARIRSKAGDRIDRLFPTKSTNLLPAIDEARRALARVDAGRKHMIILTDGKIPDSGPYYLEFVRQLRLYGITVSTVIVGQDGDDGLLKSMAEAGGGGFYQTTDPRALPKIFLNDVQVSTGERTMQEQQEFPVRRANAKRFSSELTSFPPIRGYVQTKPRSEAQLELVAMTKDKADPLLASWKVEKGRVAAFTSDANGRWSSYWMSWPKVQIFWSQLVEAMRGESDEQAANIKFDLRYFIEGGRLIIDTTLFTESSVKNVLGALTRPDGTVSELALTETAKGRFAVAVDDPVPGKYEMTVRVDGRALTPVAFALSGELFGEKRGQGVAIGELHRIASMSGGLVNPSPEQISGAGRETVSQSPVTPWLLLAVACLLLGNVLYREMTARHA